MMLTLTHCINSLPNLTGRINLAQLAQVESEHMPPHAVRWAPEAELIRVAREVAELSPEHADEAQFVAKTELHRRAVKMTVTH